MYARVILLISAAVAGVALNNGVGRTPTLSWNSWNTFACSVNETLMIETMDLLVSLNLSQAGFDTCGIDDCWAFSRDANGVIQSDPTTFPSGMKALADHAHARGLKFGLYSSNSPLTCDKRPGSYGFETIDAQTYASWGVDLLKYDNCGSQTVIGQPESRYPVMRDALNATGREFVFMGCEWAVDFPATWAAPVMHSSRTTYDIQNLWECVVAHVDWGNTWADFAHPYFFNDLDILEAWNGVLTQTESVSHLTLWAAMKSPLLIGCDLRQPGCQEGVPYFTNPEMLAISQDALGLQARRVAASGGDKGTPHGKSGVCGQEELPQNVIISECNPADPLQVWQQQANGSFYLPHTGECLQLDSGQSNHCSQEWSVWYNNAAASLCNDPASTCGGKQELWQYNASARQITNVASMQCLTVHASSLRNVGLLPCQGAMSALQTWTVDSASSRIYSSTAPPGATTRYCLARTPDVLGGALEVFAGPLEGGDIVVVLFNRNAPEAVNMTASWTDLGLNPSAQIKVRDIWARADLGIFTGSFTTTTPVDVHGVAFLRLSAA